MLSPEVEFFKNTGKMISTVNTSLNDVIASTCEIQCKEFKGRKSLAALGRGSVLWREGCYTSLGDRAL